MIKVEGRIDMVVDESDSEEEEETEVKSTTRGEPLAVRFDEQEEDEALEYFGDKGSRRAPASSHVQPAQPTVVPTLVSMIEAPTVQIPGIFLCQ